MQGHEEAARFVRALLECTVYVAPTDPGLSMEELLEAGRRLGLQPGEIRDAVGIEVVNYGPGGRLLPNRARILAWMTLKWEDPEFRNLDAIDFVHGELMDLARSEGAARVRADRGVLVQRGVAKGLPGHDVEVAVALLEIQGHLSADGAELRMSPAYASRITPKAEREQFPRGQTRRDEYRARSHSVVADIVGRRHDGRRLRSEPLDAFGEELTRLGYGHLRLWWTQMVGEVRRGDPQLVPVSITVLCAALVEGALAFAVRHGRPLGLGPFGSKTFEGEPRTWSIADLVRSAASGGPGTILDQGTRGRADALIRARQRIHAGRMMSDHPGGLPDLRPDEAREALATAETVVRRILDWLDAHRSVQGSS